MGSKRGMHVLFFFILLCRVQTYAQYVGSGSVSKGLATTITANLFPGCTGSRVSGVGTIVSTDNKTWIIPAQTNFKTGPYLPDLYNQCSGVMPAGISSVNLNTLPVTTIDPNGETITGFLFGDNYFELYINGVLVGVDPVPYTPFNSCVVKFKVSRPYTIAVKLVDWEENLGVGTELNGGNPYHPGDGGFIAAFSDGTVTDASWKAQTFYIAPVENLKHVTELSDSTRSTASATVTPTCSTGCYAIHYSIPSAWDSSSFNENIWPQATLYTPATVGVNFPAYQNFIPQWSNASFIWSSNLILDNLVLVRKTVTGKSAIDETMEESSINRIRVDANQLSFVSETDFSQAEIRIKDMMGRTVWKQTSQNIQPGVLQNYHLKVPITPGAYFFEIQQGDKFFVQKFLNQ